MRMVEEGTGQLGRVPWWFESPRHVQEGFWTVRFSCPLEGLEGAMRAAVMEYFESPLGRDYLRECAGLFTWATAVSVIPDEFWARHGILEIGPRDLLTWCPRDGQTVSCHFEAGRWVMSEEPRLPCSTRKIRLDENLLEDIG